MSDELEALYDEAMWAIGTDDHDHAEELLKEMRALLPGDPRTLEVQGDLARWTDRPQAADAAYQEILATSEDPYWCGIAHSSIAALFVDAEDFDEALQHMAVASKHFISSQSTVKTIETFVGISCLYERQGELALVVEALLSAQQIIDAQQSNDQKTSEQDSGEDDEIQGLQSQIFLMLGTAYRQQGRLEEARQSLNAALKSFQMQEQPDECANALDALGVIDQIQGRYESAEKLHLKAVEINQAIDNEEGLSMTYGNLTILCTHRKQWDEAADWAGKAFLIDKDNDDENGVAHYHLLMGEIEAERGRLDEADQHLKTAGELYTDCGDAEDLMCVQSKTAVLRRLQGRLDEASEINEAMLHEAERMGHGDGIAAILEDLAQVRKAQGRLDEARSLWERSLEAYTELDSQQMMDEVQRELDALT